MKLIRFENINLWRNELLEAIRAGKIFIYPTDTIYGLGCNAENSQAVKKIREMKQREEKPFSVIAQGKEWIRKNCLVKNEKDLELLPGPYTIIWQQRKGGRVAA